MDSANDSDHQARGQPPGRAYHVLQETRCATPGGQTRLSVRFGRVHLDTTCTTGQVRANPRARKRRLNSEGSDQRAQPLGHTMYAGSHSAQCQGTGHGQLPGWAESHPVTLDTTRSGLGPSSRAPEVSAQPGGLGSPGPSLRPIPCTPGVTRHQRRATGHGLLPDGGESHPDTTYTTGQDWA